MKILFGSVAGIVCIIGLFSCSAKLAPFGHFQDTKVIADGNDSDWHIPLRFSNAQQTYMYSVTNDKNNIYICLISKDKNEQFKILRSGIDIYFDPKGKTNKNISLEFPVKKAEQTYSNNDSYKSAPTNNRMDEDLLVSESDYYNTTGFANIENGQFSLNDKKSNLKIAIGLNNDNSLVYEAILPIIDIPGEEPGGKREGKNLSVGIVVNSSASGRSNYGNNSGFRPSIGIGGMGMIGMGMRMGRGGGQRRRQEAQQPEETNWYQFRLVTDKVNE